MPIHIFRHVPFEGAGRLETVLQQYSLPFEYWDVYHSLAVPSLNDASALVFLGGPMSANDPLPYLPLEMQLIREAVEARIPVLGICLGAQLLAKALGAQITRNPHKEIGWAPVTATPAAAEDALFCHFHHPEPIFHWHSETFSLPHQAELLATSQVCAHQAFRIGEAIYGLQFHLEVTPEMVEDWLHQDANCGDARELTTPLNPHAHQESAARLAEKVFGSWAVLVSEHARNR